VRNAIAVFVVIVAGARAAVAEPVVPVPPLMVTLGYAGGVSHLGGEVTASQLDLEVAIGAARWQAFGEALIGRGSSPDPQSASGDHDRVGLGVRWLAREVRVDATSGLDMYLESGIGLDSIAWDRGGRIQHHDVMVGVGSMIRKIGGQHLGFRFGLRVLVGEPDALPHACRGTCARVATGTTNETTPIEAGFLGVFAMQWGAADPTVVVRRDAYATDPPARRWQPARHTLGWALRLGSEPIAGTSRFAAGIGIEGGGLGIGRLRVDGEYDLLVYDGHGGSGQRLGVAVHNPLCVSEMRRGSAYLASEVGAGAALLHDDVHGRFLHGDAFAGVRFGVDARATGPSSSQSYGSYASLRAVFNPGGVGVMFGIATEWGE